MPLWRGGGAELTLPPHPHDEGVLRTVRRIERGPPRPSSQRRFLATGAVVPAGDAHLSSTPRGARWGRRCSGAARRGVGASAVAIEGRVHRVGLLLALLLALRVPQPPVTACAKLSKAHDRAAKDATRNPGRMRMAREVLVTSPASSHARIWHTPSRWGSLAFTPHGTRAGAVDGSGCSGEHGAGPRLLGKQRRGRASPPRPRRGDG